jgi:hypothetical protein
MNDVTVVNGERVNDLVKKGKSGLSDKIRDDGGKGVKICQKKEYHHHMDDPLQLLVVDFYTLPPL